MGEYAIRKSDRQEVKIGTCETMFGLRIDDIDKIEYSYKFEGCFFRLPYPEEDKMKIGEYDDLKKGYRLYKTDEDGYAIDFDPQNEEPGNVQFSNDSGMLLNIPCYHGNKLPELGEGRAFWNGRSWFIELIYIKLLPNGRTRPVYHCRFCGQMWSCEWSDIEDYLHGEMKERLSKYF